MKRFRLPFIRKIQHFPYAEAVLSHATLHLLKDYAYAWEKTGNKAFYPHLDIRVSFCECKEGVFFPQTSLSVEATYDGKKYSIPHADRIKMVKLIKSLEKNAKRTRPKYLPVE